MPTDQALKLALAKELPEYLEIHDVDTAGLHTYFIFWLDTGKEVTEREWDWVMNQVCRQHVWTADHDHDYYHATDRHNPTWTWVQRAIAYFKIIGKSLI